MSGIVDLAHSLFKALVEVALKAVNFAVEWFMELNFFDKLIVINSAAAFFAVVLSVGRYYIFDTWFYINNPLAVYMIGIVGIMGITLFFKGMISSFLRIIVNIWYMAWVIYLHTSGTLSGAPYEITPGYYMNIAVPVIYIILSGLDFFFTEKRGS